MTDARTSNGIFYRIEGDGEPLLLLHGLMVSGRMYDPLVEILKGRFRMLIPDLRGHGRSGDLPGPYDVAALTADLDVVLREAGFARGAVLGYSHGGAVAQQLAHRRPDVVRRLILGATYACNVAKTRERLEAYVFAGLLRVMSPGAIGKLALNLASRQRGGAINPPPAQAEWMHSLMADNRAPAMQGAVRGLITFDSRPWLHEIAAPTLVIAGTHDVGVPRHHYETLVSGIPGATGHLVERGTHSLIWTHTAEFAEVAAAAALGA